MIEVFRTNIQDKEAADCILLKLQHQFPDAEVNFDLEDCDKVLRINSPKSMINIKKITDIVKGLGYTIDIL